MKVLFQNDLVVKWEETIHGPLLPGQMRTRVWIAGRGWWDLERRA